MQDLRDIQAGRDALERLSAVERELREEHAAALTRFGTISSARAPVDDVVENMRRLVDEMAQRWQDDQVYGVVSSCSGRYDEGAGDGSWRFVPPTLPDAFRLRELRLSDLVGVLPELVKARLEVVIRSYTHESPGPMASRLELKAELERHVRGLEDRHTEIVDAAAGLGIAMQLLEPVRQRRASEAARLERDAAALEHRRQAEAAVDSSPVARPPASYKSSYVAHAQQREPEV